MAMQPSVHLILVTLCEGPAHGYAMMQRAEAITEGASRLTAGTLYTALQRLVAEGLVAEVRPGRPVPGDDARRRYYRLTPRGAKALAAETDRLARLIEVTRHHLGRGRGR